MNETAQKNHVNRAAATIALNTIGVPLDLAAELMERIPGRLAKRLEASLPQRRNQIPLLCGGCGHYETRAQIEQSKIHRCTACQIAAVREAATGGGE